MSDCDETGFLISFILLCGLTTIKHKFKKKINNSLNLNKTKKKPHFQYKLVIYL